jgi:IclR family KDG regulon transcriptional repressor
MQKPTLRVDVMGKKTNPAGEKQQTSGVIRTIVILETLSKHQSINLEQLSKETGLPKATLLRFLSTLVNLGYVYRDNTDLYSLTLKMFSVGSHGLEHIDLIHMGVLEEDKAVYVLKKESSFTIRMHSRVGKAIPLYCTAIGKVLLSDMPQDTLDEYLSTVKMKPFTPNTITNSEVLKQELQQIREQGWASDNEEHEMGTLCIGSPIKDYSGKVVAAMSVSWPLFRFNPEEQERITKSILKACTSLSHLLGWEGTE